MGSQGRRKQHHGHHHHGHHANTATAALLGTLGTLGLVAAASFGAAAFVAARRRAARRGVSPARWRAAFDARTGAARSARAYAALMAEVAARGLHPAARPEAWPYLLGVHEPRDTAAEKSARLARLAIEYASLQADCAALEAVLNDALAAAGVGGPGPGPASAAAAAAAASAARAALPDGVARFAEALRIVLVDAVRCDFRPPALAALGVGESAAWAVRERAREVGMARAAAAAAAEAAAETGADAAPAATTAAATAGPTAQELEQSGSAGSGEVAGIAGAAQHWLGNLLSHALGPHQQQHQQQQQTDGGGGPASSAAPPPLPPAAPSSAATRAAAFAAASATRAAVLPLPAWVSRAADRVLFEDEDEAGGGGGGGGGGAGAHLGPAGRRHAARLCALVSAYALHDPEAGYCQGMMDLAVPVLALVGGSAAAAEAAADAAAELSGGGGGGGGLVATSPEAAQAADTQAQALAFACFERFMRRGAPPARRHFLPDEAGAFSALRSLGAIVERHDRTLAHRLRALGAAGCLFAYRMLVVLGRRDLAPGQALALWEVGWADAWLRAHERRRAAHGARRAARRQAAAEEEAEEAEDDQAGVVAGQEAPEDDDDDDDAEWYGLGAGKGGLGIVDDDDEKNKEGGSGGGGGGDNGPPAAAPSSGDDDADDAEKREQEEREADADAGAGGGPLFPYFLAAVVASQRRRVLDECADPDDVLRMFHALGQEQAARGLASASARLRGQEQQWHQQQREQGQRAAAGRRGGGGAAAAAAPAPSVGGAGADDDGAGGGGEGPVGSLGEAAAALLEGARRVVRSVITQGRGAPPEALDFWACVERARAMRAVDVGAAR